MKSRDYRVIEIGERTEDGDDDVQAIHVDVTTGRAVISSCDVWMPGIYENEEAARLALAIGDDAVLQRLQNEVNDAHADFDERYIRLETLRALVAKWNGT